MSYELYHDESKEDGFWHGILLVPINKKIVLLDYLAQARKNSSYYKPIGIKKLKRRGPKYYCARSWISVAVSAMATKSGNDGLPYYTGLRGEKAVAVFHNRIGIKFILFREIDNLAKMSDILDFGGKVETTFRMGLKGGLHLLGNERESIRVVRMHFDGHQHYRRNIDKDRIIKRIYGLRGYCHIDDTDDLIDDRTSNHEKDDSQSYDDCQLLQLTDLLIGCFRSVLDKPLQDIHKDLSGPIRAIIGRYKEGYARMQNSRWRNSFCMSQCYLNENEEWDFNAFDKQNESSQQLQLFD